MIRFDFPQGQWASVHTRPENLDVQAGFGVHRLRITGLIKGHDLNPEALIEIADLALAVRHPTPRWLTTGGPFVTQVHGQFETGFAMTFALSDHQVRLLDELRDGGDLSFALEGRAHILGQRSLGVSESTGHLSIPASTWTTMIERAKLGTSATVSITLVGADDAHREAAECLQKARRALTNGDVDAAILSVRKSLERTTAIAGWRKGTGSDHKLWSQAERWFAIMQAAMTQASGAVHDDPLTKTFVYSRAEAEALIGMAASLLKAAPSPLT